MRILCLSYEYPPLGGGGSIVCQGLSTALAKRGHHVDIVTSGCKNFPEHERRNGVNIHRVRCFRRNVSYTNSLELATVLYPMYVKALELISRHPYDINHTHFIIPTGFVSHWVYLKTHLPYIITAHGSDIPGYNRDRFRFEHQLLAPYWRCIIKRSRGIISPSIALKQLIHKKIDAQITVIPNGFNPTDADGAFEGKENMVLMVTRMFERKGVQYLIEAIRKMSTEWEFVIVGDGPYLPRVRALAAGLKQRVQIKGYIKGAPLFELYRKAKIFVFPSSKENFPIVLLEAMDAGCAVITTLDKGCCEVVGQAALKVEPRSAGQIRSALNYLMGNEEEVKRLSLQARKRVAELAWPEIARNTEAYFEEVLAS
jgi:glycosyltransferase involved in cell wall biosynthesis